MDQTCASGLLEKPVETTFTFTDKQRFLSRPVRRAEQICDTQLEHDVHQCETYIRACVRSLWVLLETEPESQRRWQPQR